MGTLSTTTSSDIGSISSPSAGDAYFVTDTGKLAVYNGSAFNLTNYDTTYNSGADEISQYSVNFDGTNDIASKTSPSSDLEIDPQNGDDYTVVAWVNLKDASETYNGIFSIGEHAAHKSRSFILKSQKVGFWTHSGDYVASDTTVAVGAWTFVAVTINGTTTNGVKFYVNGSVEGQTFTFSDTAVATWDDAVVGDMYANSGTSAHTFRGSIDQVGVWNDVLTATEITALYNGGYASRYDANHGNYASSANLQGWWKMGDADSGTGSTITDSSSNSNHLTLTNGAIIHNAHAPSKF